MTGITTTAAVGATAKTTMEILLSMRYLEKKEIEKVTMPVRFETVIKK
jgi:hypothetical protein